MFKPTAQHKPMPVATDVMGRSFETKLWDEPINIKGRTKGLNARCGRIAAHLKRWS
jgi:hypothetical protein